MKKEKIKEALQINAKLLELGLDINSSEWDGFKFSLNEWGNLEIKSGKLDHKPFVSTRELTFEYVSTLAKKKGLTLAAAVDIETEKVKYYEIYEREDRTLFTCKTLQEVINYLSDF